MKKRIEEATEPGLAAEKALQDLAKVAFANVLDFARFEPDGTVHIFDYDKAREVGAKVSVTTRKIGRGKNAKEVRTTRIRMPDKLPALLKLVKRLGFSETRWKHK